MTGDRKNATNYNRRVLSVYLCTASFKDVHIQKDWEKGCKAREAARKAGSEKAEKAVQKGESKEEESGKVLEQAEREWEECVWP